MQQPAGGGTGLRKTPTVEALEMRVEVALENHNADAPEIQFFRADENNA